MRYRNKKDWIIPYINRKKVLDLGCVQHDLSNINNPNWLHGNIVKHAKTVLGVDCLENEVKVLKEQGLNVICANVEEITLDDKFEVIVAGDLIEHLPNPGRFLERVYDLLTPDGIFLVTTPNPVHFMRFIQLFLRGRVTVNSEHTCWFNEEVLLQLAGRYGFEVLDVVYLDDSYQYYEDASRLWIPFLMLNYLLCLISPKFSETLCVAFKKSELQKNE